MFESGKWKAEDSSEEESEDEDNENETWNLEALRKETERLRAQKEEERLAKLHGAGVVPDGPVETVSQPVVQEGDG